MDGKKWHLEDSNLSSCDAEALKRHLKKTEDKKARIHKTKDGNEVWWAKQLLTMCVYIQQN